MPYVAIKSAASYPNGIAIRSRYCPDLAVKVFEDLHGNIRHALLPSVQTRLYSPSPFEKRYYEISQKIAIGFDIILILILLLLKQFGYVMLAISFSFFLSVPLAHFFTDIYILQFTAMGKKNAMFHAAEHKMVNAYHKYQKVPTFQQIKEASRYTTLCGSLETLIPIFSQLILFLLLILANEMFVKLSLKVIAMFLSGGISFLFHRYGENIFQYLEILITKTPTDKELIIALETIKGFTLLEDFLAQEVSDDAIENFFDNAELTKEASES